MQQAIILHHHEIILKGNNRGFFERQLLNNVRAVLAGLVPANAVGGGYGRFIVLLDDGAPVEEIVAEVYGEYQRRLQRANAVDFDDIIGHTVALLQAFPDIAELRSMVMTIWYDTMPTVDYLLFIDSDMPPKI